MPSVSSSSFLNAAQVSRTNARPAVSSDKSRQLGKQDFLKLLLAQLQNQDPMKPKDDTQMIAQMAQFSALEAMQQLSTTITRNNNVQTVAQAGALIGKYVQADQPDGTSIVGTVSGVTFTTTDGVVSPTLVVNGKNVDYSTIRKVSTTPIAAA